MTFLCWKWLEFRATYIIDLCFVCLLCSAKIQTCDIYTNHSEKSGGNVQNSTKTSVKTWNDQVVLSRKKSGHPVILASFHRKSFIMNPPEKRLAKYLKEWEETRPWLKPGDNSSIVKCTACSKQFQVDWSGISQVNSLQRMQTSRYKNMLQPNSWQKLRGQAQTIHGYGCEKESCWQAWTIAG